MSQEPAATGTAPANGPRQLAFFERYLTVWVLACMAVGVGFGKLLPGVTASDECCHTAGFRHYLFIL